MRNKLGNKKVEYDGIVFDSKMERDYYIYLKQQEHDGKIEKIILQPKVELQPAFKKYGKSYRAITYTPDFFVKYRNGFSEYIDVKGFSMTDGKIRRKLFAYQNEFPLTWITASKKYSKTGWIDYDELQAIRAKNKKARE